MNPNNNIASICQRYGIILMYLFGSCAQKATGLLTGDPVTIEDPLADLDVGVVFDRDLPPLQDRYRLYAAISNALDDLFQPLPVDLSFLQENHSVFQLEAVKGICVYTGSKAIQEDYEEMVLCKAADFRPFLELYLADALEEIIS